MRLGVVIKDTWAFFHEIYADLAEHHHTTLFEPRTVTWPLWKERINGYLFEHDLQRFMRANDVVFFEWAGELLASASHRPKTCGIVTRLHRYELYQWADKVNWNTVDRIILVSKAKEREFTARFPEEASKTVIIPEAISPERFRPATKSFTGDLGTVCSLIPRKRVYDLILTFYELSKDRDDLHLHIGGGPRSSHLDYYEALGNLVQKLNLQTRVTFHGHLAKPEDWYHLVDIFISNSYSEGLQVSPMEAMASGCYCLCHHWDGAEELLPEQYLFYTNGQLQDKILRYCEGSEADRQMHRAALQAIVRDRFNVHHTKIQIRHVIEAVQAGLHAESEAGR